MVAVRQLGLATLLWLGLVNQGLALGIDETTNDLMLVQRGSGNFFNVAPILAKPRSEDIQLGERNFDGLDERDLDLEERGFRKGFNPGVAKWKKPRDLEARGFRKGFNPGVAKWKKPRDVEERGFRKGFNPGVAKWKKPRDVEERGFVRVLTRVLQSGKSLAVLRNYCRRVSSMLKSPQSHDKFGSFFSPPQ